MIKTWYRSCGKRMLAVGGGGAVDVPWAMSQTGWVSYHELSLGGTIHVNYFAKGQEMAVGGRWIEGTKALNPIVTGGGAWKRWNPPGGFFNKPHFVSYGFKSSGIFWFTKTTLKIGWQPVTDDGVVIPSIGSAIFAPLTTVIKIP